MAKWTNEQVDVLKSLWGKKTASAIAAELGCFTRNAVIGKASRLHLSLLQHSTAVMKKSNRRCSITKLYTELKKRGTNIKTGKVICQWPKGEPDKQDFTFCGQEVQENESYCFQHCTAAYKKRVR